MNGGLRLTATGLKKVFNRRTIFQNVSFSLEGKQTLLVTGRNGSGKSTLVKILCGLLSPTAGEVAISGSSLDGAERLAQIGMVAPYLQMYDEFSAEENIRFGLTMRGLRPDEAAIEGLLARVGLLSRKKDPVRAYSSGMKQRVKYAFALIHRPPILVLDEPMANLDTEGMRTVRGIMEEHRSAGLLIVATNDLTDVDRFDLQVNFDELAGR